MNLVLERGPGEVKVAVQCCFTETHNYACSPKKLYDCRWKRALLTRRLYSAMCNESSSITMHFYVFILSSVALYSLKEPMSCCSRCITCLNMTVHWHHIDDGSRWH